MVKDNKRDKKVQGFTTTEVLHGLNQVEIAENKKQSAVIHDALIMYIKNHPDVQLSVKRQISIQNISEKMHVLSQISSNLNEFSNFESNFVAFCIDLNNLKPDKTKKLSLIGDAKDVLNEIGLQHADEYNKYVKIGRKLLNKRAFGLIFANEVAKGQELTKEALSVEYDLKNLSKGEFFSKYGVDASTFR